MMKMREVINEGGEARQFVKDLLDLKNIAADIDQETANKLSDFAQENPKKAKALDGHVRSIVDFLMKNM